MKRVVSAFLALALACAPFAAAQGHGGGSFGRIASDEADRACAVSLLGKTSGFMDHETYLREIRKWWDANIMPATPAEAETANGGSDLQPSVRRAKRPAHIDDMAMYLKWKWRMDVSDPSSGLGENALKEGLRKAVAQWKKKEAWADVQAHMLDFLVDRCALGFSRFDCFPAISCWNRFNRPAHKILRAREEELDAATAPDWFHEARFEVFRSGGRASRDYCHSAPDWDDILTLGFPGMKARADSYATDTAFYRSERKAAAALMRFLDRLVAGAEAELSACGGKTDEGLLEKEIASLRRLREGPPRTTFDVLEFMFIYFIVGEYFDWFQVRTFGNIDRLLWPYYCADLKAGRTTEAEFREDFRHFIWQFGSIDNYWGHPMYLGGTKADGSTEYNPLSMIILDVVDREALPTPKFQLKMAGNTPDDIWRKALDMLRRHRSLVLMGEKGMARSMKRLGLSAEECRKLVIWGCFEWLPVCGNCTSACDINLVKPIEQMLADAKDGAFRADDFAAFKDEYHARLARLTDMTCAVMNVLERGIPEINLSLVLSLGVGSAMEKGEDAFSTGMLYNHTAISEVAFASAVDSLVAVKEIVYDSREMSLQELGEVLAADWKDHEPLRLRMARSRRKWGCGDEFSCALGRELLEKFTGRFVGKPNARGGRYCCYGLNSRGYITAGRVTGATPDGRHAGDELSKNMAPAIGGDAEGVTAVINSWEKSVAPEFFPCGLVLDLMMHSSSVSGQKGLEAFRAICERFFKLGGCALNLNIQSVEELKDAQVHPERYENLQVRVAGWNIRWNDIPKKEQDGFIRRLEAMPR